MDDDSDYIDLLHNRTIPGDIQREVYERDNGKCVKCGNQSESGDGLYDNNGCGAICPSKYYNEIIELIKSVGDENDVKENLRKVSFRAMQNDKGDQ